MGKIIRKEAADDFSSNIDDGMLFSLLSPTAEESAATFDSAANVHDPIHFILISSRSHHFSCRCVVLLGLLKHDPVEN
jgi:hypothetical protein